MTAHTALAVIAIVLSAAALGIALRESWRTRSTLAEITSAATQAAALHKSAAACERRIRDAQGRRTTPGGVR